MLTRLLNCTLRRWAVVIDYDLPAPWRVIDSYHRSARAAQMRCRSALRPLALLINPRVATIHITRTADL